LIVRGLTNTGIAEALGIRLGTVEFHISAIFDKVGVNSRAALIATLMGI
jgi:DNA-binding NarL/FixJ family response regulator